MTSGATRLDRSLAAVDDETAIAISLPWGTLHAREEPRVGAVDGDVLALFVDDEGQRRWTRIIPREPRLTAGPTTLRTLALASQDADLGRVTAPWRMLWPEAYREPPAALLDQDGISLEEDVVDDRE